VSDTHIKAIVEIRTEMMIAAGISLVEGRCPGAPGHSESGLRHGGSGWTDHIRRVAVKGKPTQTWVGFPYQLHADDMIELCNLARDGWDVCVTGLFDVYRPGDTVAVMVSKDSGSTNLFSSGWGSPDR
jgi:hypothetical protein